MGTIFHRQRSIFRKIKIEITKIVLNNVRDLKSIGQRKPMEIIQVLSYKSFKVILHLTLLLLLYQVFSLLTKHYFF